MKYMFKFTKFILLVLATLTCKDALSQIPVSVPFNQGFVARQKTNLNSVDAYKIFSNSDLNIKKAFFVQYVNSGNVFVMQGNDIAGFCRLEFLNGNIVEIPGTINWQEKNGSTTILLGFIPTNSTRVNLKNYNGASNDYFIDGGKTQTNIASNIYTANIGLKYNNQTMTLTDGANLQGSADQPSLADLNAYLASVRSLDPNGPVTVNSLTTTNTTPTLTGSVTLATGETLSVQVNGVVYYVGANLSVSGNTWTLNIPSTTPTGTYEVTAVITNSGGYILTDATINELVIIPPPTITTSGTLSAFTTCSGVASTTQTVTVSGANLTNNITLTAPTGYELSTSGSSYSNTVTLTQSGGTVSSTTIYVRLTSAATNGASGTISVTSTGATSQAFSISAATVNALPTITLGATSSVSSSATSFSLPYTATSGRRSQ